MFTRLYKALRYLVTGSLGDDASPEAGDAPRPTRQTQSASAPPVSVRPPVSAANEASYLILRDIHENANGRRTSIEVRSDGIHLSDNGASEQGEQLIPLNADAFSLANIDEDVRLQITRKITLLLPELAEAQKNDLLRHVFRVLFLLAEDQLPRVRQMIAEELRERHDAPPELARQLAWDEELEVAAPILEFSPLLGDSDLLDIIAGSEIPGVVESISRRKEVSTHVTDAIVRNVTSRKMADADANARIINNLLSNKTARFSENALDMIAEEAPRYEIWHSPLIDRPELSTRTINKIARFVSEALIMEMEERGMITRELGQNLTQAIASRLYNPHIDREKEADKLAIELFTQGTLDTQYVMAALDGGQPEFVIASLSLLADVPKAVVKRMIEGHDAQAVVALSWKAGVPMRDAIQLQLRLAKIHHSKLLYARGGKFYPLSEREMRDILQKYTLSAA